MSDSGDAGAISHWRFWISVAYYGYRLDACHKSGPGNWMAGNYDAGIAEGLAYLMGWKPPIQHECQDTWGNRIGVLKYP